MHSLTKKFTSVFKLVFKTFVLEGNGWPQDWIRREGGSQALLPHSKFRPKNNTQKVHFYLINANVIQGGHLKRKSGILILKKLLML
jgi:hypothetical protein